MILPNENLLKAISWTLVHSVWQGLILAVFAGLVILFTKKSSASLRYNWLSGLFLAFIIVVGFTFNYEYQNENLTIPSGDIIITAQVKPELIAAQEITISSNYFQAAIEYLNTNSAAIVLIWFLVFAVKSFGIFRSLSNIYRIRNYRTQSPPEYWSNRLSELSQTLHIKKRIVLLESQLVKVPSVTGFFKPIILIPVGLLSNLPQDQIEAILLHELAHIRRKDYFINLIQSFAEILFFFNPGVLWVSSIIKEERENCCDDIAVGITKSKSKFIHALVSFQEYNMKQNELAMGFGGNKNQLLERAKRIIYDNNKSLNSIEKTFLSICIIVIASVTLACSNTKAVASNSQEKPLLSREVDDTHPSTPEELVAYNEAMEEAELAQIEAEKAQSEAQITQNEAAVAQSEAEIAQKEAEEAQQEAERPQQEAEQMSKQDEQIQKMKAKDSEIKVKAKAKVEVEKLQILKIKGEGRISKLGLDKIKSEDYGSRSRVLKIKGEGRISREGLEKIRTEVQKGKFARNDARSNAQLKRVEAQKAKLEAKKEKIDAELAKLKTKLKIERFSNDSIYFYKPGKAFNYNKSDKVIALVPKACNSTEEIISVLVNENVVVNVQNYKVSSDNSIVNGKVLSEDIHNKVKVYLKPNASIYYNYDVKGEDILNDVKIIKSEGKEKKGVKSKKKN